ncbi:glycosyltransferase family 2 protein [Winogradskyella sp. KYW1333]|uniref:glycosyltransferase family 2 protein n=1 Tax=Winogradskyella sp. KYW1333 TaxID=2282123 RepID=UPI000DF4972A|nr:glycosyltransferase family 2 protein [Winogradskyella sp. KYW1333]RCT54801.1 glycosyltransferase family 2 protein [Winogradskyella sp. KYW1333]
MKSEFTIIVPIFNEEDNLARLEKELNDYINIAPLKTSVLLVNDGSTDNSLSKIEGICIVNDAFEFISFENNQGLSTALKAGFDYVTCPLVGYMDADLQTSPEDFNLLLEHIDQYELVSGVRHNRKDTLLKNLSSKMANRVRRLFTNDGMEDTGCPLKVFKTETAKGIPMFRGLHRFLPAMTLLQNGCVKQVPVRHFPRQAGTSKYGFGKRLLGPLADCFAFLWMKRKYINYQIDKSSSDSA